MRKDAANVPSKRILIMDYETQKWHLLTGKEKKVVIAQVVSIPPPSPCS
jgi:hypothetical protein